MKFFITVFTIVLITQNAVPVLPLCEFENTTNENEDEIKSTSDYLELNKKYIDNVSKNYTIPPDRTITHNGYKYFANEDGLFVKQESESSATKIDGFDQFTTIILDKKFNQIYLGTRNGLFALRCGATKTKKIQATNNISVDFGVVDNIGNIYFGTDGDNTMLSEELYILRKEDNKLLRISGIEKTLGSYTIENIGNSNKIAVDSKNNVYVGAFTSYIYLIKSGETIAIKLKDLRNSGGVTSVVVDSKDNVYFRTNNALYILKSNGTKLNKITESIDDFNYFLSIDENDVYFQVVDKTYALKSEEVIAIEIKTISNSMGYTQINFNNIRNVNVKNKILYLTTIHNDKEIICAMQQNETSLTEIHRTDNEIISLAVDNYNNLYYITFSSASQKYVPFVLRKNAKIPIEIRGVTGHLSYVFSDNNNNIYFGSGNGLHILKEDEVTPYKLRATESQISSFVVDKSDNVYFGTDYDGAFVLKSGEIEATKIDGIDKKFGSYVETFGDKKYDIVYFKTGGALYQLKGGDTLVTKVIEAFSPEIYFSDCMNNIYYVSENSSIFSVSFNETIAKHVTDIDGQVLRINSDSANNIYFVTDNNQLHVVRRGKKIPEKLTDDLKVTSLNIDREDNVYFTTDNDLLVLRSGEKETTKIHNIYNQLEYFVTNDNGIYFITSKNDHKKGLFLLQNKLQFDTILKNRNLGQIDDNDDETILNMLNYVNLKDNYLLSKSKNKIINKTGTSATILATKGKYAGRFNVTYIIKDKDVEDGRNFDLSGLLKKAIFFDYANRNLYSIKKPNEIKDIYVSTDNLKFSIVEVTRDSELLSSVEFKNVCFNKKKVANTSPLSQTIKIPECNYEIKEMTSFYITNGLNKTNEVNEETVAAPLNEEDEKALTNFLNINDKKNVELKVVLSNSFDLSNLMKHSHEMTLHNFTEDEQEIIIPPKQRILVNYSVRSLVLKTVLNLKETIKGTLVATIIDTNSEQTVQVTVKEAMQTLKKYNLLPNDISINEDNSITFNGKATLIIKRESEPKIIRNFYDI